MNPDSNRLQRDFWNGPAGERWVREQQQLDRAFAAITQRLFEAAAIGPGERILDVGCGTGTTTLLAAGRAGAGGRVLGVDLSAPMLGFARERTRGVANIALREADAMTHAWAPEFDLLLSRFGVMFFAEPTRAFAALRTALVAGGRVVFACWRGVQDNEWVQLPFELVARKIGAALPPPREPGPFAFAERAYVEQLLSGAGYRDISLEPFDAPVRVSERGLEEALGFALEGGVAGRALREASEAIRREVRDELRPMLAPRVQPDGKVELGGAVWLVRARAP